MTPPSRADDYVHISIPEHAILENQPVYTIAFSGHRPSNDPAKGPGRSDAALSACRGPLRELFVRLRAEAEMRGQRIELITSVAAGADLEATEVAEDLGIPTHVVLPKPIEEFAKDFAGYFASDWPRAKQQIDLARHGEAGRSLRIVTDAPAGTSVYAHANAHMLAHADALVVVWNGQDTGQPGGTAHMIESARTRGLAIEIIDPAAA